MSVTQTRIPSADVSGDGETIYVVDLSAITPDEPVDVTTGQATGAAVDPHRITWDVRTRATLGSPVVQVTHEAASDVAASGTARVRVSTVPGGDLAGAVVRVFFHYTNQASGAIS